MQIPQIPTSRWFLYLSSSLLVVLCLAVLLAGLLLTWKSSQPRIGLIAGSSMEPTLAGPRARIVCTSCQTELRLAIDALIPDSPMRCPTCKQWNQVGPSPNIQPGGSIVYRPVQRAAQSSDAATREPIRRGDVVVLERHPGAAKELKRVVALPGEELAIQAGDLWIDQRRYQKTLSAALAQSVLVAAWDRDRCRQSLKAFLQGRSFPPSNDLSLNAHDSHVLVDVFDFGIAFRCVELRRDAPFEMRLSDANHRYHVRITTAEKWTAVCNDVAMTRQSIVESENIRASRWIIVAMIDGRMLVGDEFGNGFADELSTLAKTPSDEVLNDPAEDAVVLETGDHWDIDLAFIFRDLHYRGYGDTPEATFPAGPGYVFLGDNVSISDDSRGPAGSQTRWGWDRIRGVVMESPEPLASLMNQHSLVDLFPCD